MGNMKSLIASLLIAFTFPAMAADFIGYPAVSDGDTLKFDGQRVRLLSIDAFESAQYCKRGPTNYPCGAEATAHMISLIGNREVRCSGDKADRYNRPLVHCWVGDTDLNRAMVRSGWALAAYGHEYDPDQELAREERVGAWAGTFQNPADWRRSARR